ncbi:MAG: conjugal transfer protein TraD [Legionellales bacterium]|nr:conjugal transfer protein TraD [Legionellales bacterium]
MKKQLYLLKEKQRKLDTRRKIELGGLIIKAGLAEYPKAIILGGLYYLLKELEREPEFENILKQQGELLFMGFDE